MFTIGVVFVGIWILAIGITLWGTVSAHRAFSAKHKTSQDFKPVSILKPLKGWDAGLPLNLRSFFCLDYPNFELLFCLENDRDAALPCVEALCKEFPQVPTRIFFSGSPLSGNPKVYNLREAYRLSKYDHILISDSNVRVPSNYLRELVPELTHGVGVVTAVVAGTSWEGWGGQLEALYLNTFYARWMFLASQLGFPTVVGKSMLFLKSTTERFGGIQTLACYIAEDYMAGRAMVNLGLRVVLAKIPVRQFIGKYSFRDFWTRHLRWGRIRKSHAPIAFLFEPCLCFVPSGILGAVAYYILMESSPLPLLIVHLVIWCSCDLSLMGRLAGLNRRSLVGWLLREFLAVPQWIHVAIGNTVSWRGRSLKLESGGYLAAGQFA